MPVLPEPIWSDRFKKDTTNAPDTLMSKRNGPILITGFLQRMLEAKFADTNNLENKVLRENAVWTEKDNTGVTASKIRICTDTDWETTTADQTPALYIQFGGANTNQFIKALNKQAMGGWNKDGTFRGTRHILDISGTHNIISVSKGAIASLSLAEEAWYWLLEYYKLVQKDLNMSFDVGQLGSPQYLPSSKELFATQMTCSWSFAYNWTIDEQAPILRQITLTPQ